jgi:hypothetical protein
MANRMFTQFEYSLEKAVVSIYCTVTGAGSPNNLVLNSWSGSAYATAGTGGYKGVKSITRNADGDYTFVFQDNYNRLIDFGGQALALDGSTTPLAVATWLKAVSPSATGGATVRVIFYLATPGTPVAPGTNDRWLLYFGWSNSSAQ